MAINFGRRFFKKGTVKFTKAGRFVTKTDINKILNEYKYMFSPNMVRLWATLYYNNKYADVIRANIPVDKGRLINSGAIYSYGELIGASMNVSGVFDESEKARIPRYRGKAPIAFIFSTPKEVKKGRVYYVEQNKRYFDYAPYVDIYREYPAHFSFRIHSNIRDYILELVGKWNG